MYEIIQEGSARIKVPKTEKISSKMEVFYNPAMRINRDIAILFLKSIISSALDIALPLEATGIRGIRFLKEIPKKKINGIAFNDLKKEAVLLIKKNLRLNRLTGKKIIVANKDANLFLQESSGFDYIDIDPFGSPNPFLDSAVKRLRSDGYLAITCTDTASLSGTYPNACLRKYWATPIRDTNMHETGIRILLRKVQLIGSQYHKALLPVFCYYHLHYFRAYFKCLNSKKATEGILAQHGMIGNAGPLWIGRLWDNLLVSSMVEKSSKETAGLLNLIKEESLVDTVGFFDIHELCSSYKISTIPKMEDILTTLVSLGYSASRTHFSPTGVRSNITKDELIEVIKKKVF